MTLVRLGRLRELVSVAQVTQWLGEVRAAGAPAALPAPHGSTARRRKKKSPEPVADRVEAVSQPVLSAETLPRVWPRILGEIGGFLARDLEKANLPAIFGPNTLVFTFAAAYNQVVERCQTPGTVTRLEEAIRKVTGRAWTLRFESAPSPTPSAPVPSPGEVEPAPARARGGISAKRRKNSLLVRRAKEVLGGQIVRADEGFGESNSAPTNQAAPETRRTLEPCSRNSVRSPT